MYMKSTATNSLDWLLQNSQTDGSQSLKQVFHVLQHPKYAALMTRFTLAINSHPGNKEVPFKGCTVHWYFTKHVFYKNVVTGHI